MKTQRFKTQFNPEYKGRQNPEINDQPSMTQQGMSLTIKELFHYHTRGGGNVKIYDPIFTDLEVPVFTDIEEMNQYKMQLKENLKAVNETIERELNEKKKVEMDAKLQEKEDLIKSHEKQVQNTTTPDPS
jgi:hypothetical protein